MARANSINILGLGETLNQYKPNGGITIGVNDICTFVDVDILVLQDKPHAFSFERYENIINILPTQIFTNQKEWQEAFNYRLVKLIHEEIKPGYDSTYLAIKIAAVYYKPTQINLYGVDFTNHPQHSTILPKIIEKYTALAQALADLNIKLCCTRQSALFGIKNIYPIEN